MRYDLKVRATLGYVDLYLVRIPPAFPIKIYSSNGVERHWDDM